MKGLVRAVLVDSVAVPTGATVAPASMVKATIEALRRDGSAVVVAPTGTGKTTTIPPAILDAGLAGKQRVVITQPRRLTARAVAEYVAVQRGGRVGEEVGYSVRFDERICDETRLLYVTDGTLMRMLIANATDDVGTFVFDEFHERSLFGDVALALVRLKHPTTPVVVMSATLDISMIQDYLGSSQQIVVSGAIRTELVRRIAKTIPAAGRRHHVDIVYAPGRTVADIIDELPPGDVLVFQPGKREIADCITCLRVRNPDDIIVPLHSAVSDDDRDRALNPAPPSRRKIVVATNIAETSLTIPSVRYVIDTGTERVFEYEHGIGTLKLRAISQSSATQRAGRCGRTGDGVCYRLWSAEEHAALPRYRVPEIKRMNLSNVVLLLKAAGITDVNKLPFLDHPGKERILNAEQELAAIGALDERGVITEIGRQMSKIPVVPRYSRTLIEARRLSCQHTVAIIVALMSVQNVLIRPRGMEQEADQAHAEFIAVAREKLSDAFALLAAYRAAATADFSREFCRDKFLRRSSLLEARSIFRQIAAITNINADDDADLAPASVVRRALAAGARDTWRSVNYNLYINHRAGACTYAQIARNSALLSVLPAYIVADRVWQIRTRRGPLTLLSNVTAIEQEQMR